MEVEKKCGIYTALALRHHIKNIAANTLNIAVCKLSPKMNPFVSKAQFKCHQKKKI